MHSATSGACEPSGSLRAEETIGSVCPECIPVHSPEYFLLFASRLRRETLLQRWSHRQQNCLPYTGQRCVDFVKEQGQTARTIIIAAASVVVLSPVLGAVVDLVSRFLPHK